MTTSTLTFHGRLPGVDCNPALPAGGAAIRLDVAAFVGFAERGPLDLPVAVEDINQYRAVFGGDVVLATDGGTPVYANLPGAVREFFDNGGRRCHIVRVAGREANAPRAARWLVPGLRLWQPDGVVEDVHLDAAWPGKWSDGYGVGTQLVSEPLSIRVEGGVREPYHRAVLGDGASPAKPGILRIAAGSLLLVQVGDLLRLDLGPLQPGLYITVAAVDRVHSTVEAGVEIAFLSEVVSSPEPNRELLLPPDALHSLPGTLPVVGAFRLQMDLLAREVNAGAAGLLEHWSALGFNAGTGRSWLDVVQPFDTDVPDQSRSMLMRADPHAVDALAGGCLFLPAGMDQLGSSAEFVDAVVGPSGESGAYLGLDGLTSFEPISMFLDHRLVGTTVYSLLGEADQLTVLAKDPIRLQGIHALINVGEVGLLSVPDAVHVGWSHVSGQSPGPEPPSDPVVVPPPDWTYFRDCAVPKETSTETAIEREDTSHDAPEPQYPVLDDPARFDPTPLVEVHTAMAQLGAARNDLFSILGVPRHFDTAAVLAWLQALGERSRDTQGGRIVMSPLSFAGFWHPWVRVVESTTPFLAPLRDEPADGSVCGMIAARELARGVWVAPANVPLRGPVGLARSLSATDTVRLFDGHANLLRAQPGVISCLSAHTLSTDPTLLQVSVRRLIILLRKIALLEGSRYVFDVNTDRFRQLVRLRFERILANLTRLGGLTAFQVVTAGGVNTQDDIDNGRLIVSLQIAPTSPIEFITVTLLRSGEGLLDVVVG